MSDEILAGIAQGFFAPRRAMRRVLDLAPGPDVVLGLVILGYLVQGVSVILVPGAREGIEGSILVGHLNMLISQLLLFALTGAAVFGVGRVFGGLATLPQSLVAVAWYSFVTSFLSPAALYGLTSAAAGEPAPLAVLLLMGSVVIGLWVFAGCVAEVHGFRSSAGVFGATIGVLLLASAFLLMLLPPP